MLRILITDDSVVFRSQIRAALENYPGIEVVGAASNGKIALEKLEQESIDLITLDIEMPEMSGLETLREIKKRGLKTKVLMFSSLTKQGSETTLAALSLGAEDFVTKPAEADLTINNAASRIREKLLPKILQFIETSPDLPEPIRAPSPLSKSSKAYAKPSTSLTGFQPSAIVIGSSTGGPAALEEIFLGLKGRSLRCPILIVQHMPPVFTATLAQRIGKLTGIESTEAKHLDPLQPKIYVAPGDYHMEIKFIEARLKIVLDQTAQRNSVRPAVDPLFESAAQIFGSQCMGFVLTGMGSDGALGAVAIKERGGRIMIQNKESCVVFGMPGAVFTKEAYDDIGDLKQIQRYLVQMASTI